MEFENAFIFIYFNPCFLSFKYKNARVSFGKT